MDKETYQQLHEDSDALLEKIMWQIERALDRGAVPLVALNALASALHKIIDFNDHEAGEKFDAMMKDFITTSFVPALMRNHEAVCPGRKAMVN
jgi:hypothetical protein